MDRVFIPLGVKIQKDEWMAQDPETQKKIYIAHGDLVDQSDEGYLRLRAFFRNPVIRSLIHVMPGKWIQKIAQQLSRSPDHQKADLPEKWPEHDRNRLRSVFRSFARQQKADIVILGHCHDLDEEPPFYWNMGYPPVHRQFLYYDSANNRVIRRDFPRIP